MSASISIERSRHFHWSFQCRGNIQNWSCKIDLYRVLLPSSCLESSLLRFKETDGCYQKTHHNPQTLFWRTSAEAWPRPGWGGGGGWWWSWSDVHLGSACDGLSRHATLSSTRPSSQTSRLLGMENKALKYCTLMTIFENFFFFFKHIYLDSGHGQWKWTWTWRGWEDRTVYTGCQV